MKFSETTASTCRYGSVAEKIWGDWEVLWEDSVADYQGHASFLAKKGRQYTFYEWHYGSCSGCDGWEADGLDDAAVEAEMRRAAAIFKSKTELKNWLTMLEGGNDAGKNPVVNYSMERGGGLAAGLDLLSGGLRDRVNAIRKELGMKELP